MSTVSKDKYQSMKDKASKWRETALKFQETNEELLAECQTLRDRIKDVDDLINDLRVLQKQKDKSDLEHERQLLRKDAENDRLKASLEDYKERYREIRDDNKELRNSMVPRAQT